MKKPTGSVENWKSRSGQHEGGLFGGRGNASGLRNDYAFRFACKVMTVFKQSGRLRTMAGTKQLEQIVRGADQLPFRAGFRQPA